MDESFEESAIKLAGLVMSLQSRIQALEVLVFVLGTKQGLDLEKMKAMLQEKAKALDEKMLLEVGDQDPRLADLADVLERLKEPKEGEDGKNE
jgi:hypothetical protein